jgi:predicted transcriptional regulator
MATIIERADTIVDTKRAIAMTTVGGGKKQLNIHDRIRLAICSELRRNILVTLMDGKKALSELRKTLEVSSTTAIHALRDLEKNKLIFEDEKRNYGLTKIGEIIALKIVDFVDAVDVLQKHEEFWLTHDLSGIPPHLMERVGWLNNSTLMEDTSLDIFKVHSTYIELLKTVTKVRGISSIFDPHHPKVYGELLRSGIDVQLVLTEEVLEKVIEASSAELRQSGTLVIYIGKKPLKMGFTVTDKFLSLGLYHVNGSYDYNRDILSYDKRAIEWGYELFEYHREMAEKCKI